MQQQQTKLLKKRKRKSQNGKTESEMPEMKEKIQETSSKNWLGIVLILLYLPAMGQYGETIRTDRPGQAIVPFTVGQGIFQTQTGIDYFRDESPAYRDEVTIYTAGTYLRMGVSERFEVNGAIAYSEQQDEFSDTQLKNKGISQLEMGVRSNIREGEGLSPSLGFQYSLKFPSPSAAFKSKYVASHIMLSTYQELIKKTGLTTNWGLDWSDNGQVTGLYVLNISYGLSAQWGIFAEHYGSIFRDAWTGKFDGGLAYLVTDHLQLDLYGGWGSLNNSAAGERMENNYFISLGFSWRTHRN